MKWSKEEFDNRVLLICASAQEVSINGRLMEKFAHKLESEGITIGKVYLRKYIDVPLLLDDVSVIPEPIHELFDIIASYKYLVIFAPEHCGYFSAFFKNILDWLCQIKHEFMQDKGIVVVSASITKRTKRSMEEGVKNTFTKFMISGEIEFVNYNRYDIDGESEERIEELFKNLWSDTSLL